ncbi:hypothetical protein [Siphonobacter sp. SORGH_AS_1065]|uniref:hypothetical protein n=1 Tax=Siphonobacter sp. SORGH_AS_1065 TaxID=3041795 RepID=UPI00277EB620|nr:hypothetical protein [Siphonobacter sp. SORGH_AS_1065]MDQ1090021.1 hypothetical protein [Siphonobacter sp. SORGH_AS_1065]
MKKQTVKPEFPEYYNKRILTVEEASWCTGLARGTLRNMTCTRMIPYYTINPVVS